MLQRVFNQNHTPFTYEELYRLTLDNFPGSVLLMDWTGRILYCNQVCERMLSCKKDWLLTADIQTVVNRGFASESIGLQAIAAKSEVLGYNFNYSQEGVLVTGIPFFAGDTVKAAVVFSQEEVNLRGYVSYIAETSAAAEKLKFPSYREYRYSTICAESAAMKSVLQQALRIAPSTGTVSILGESGVGKELLARFIYEHSKRVHAPFLPINCSAIPLSLAEAEFFGYERGAFTGALREGKAGLFELSNGGTLFLDEIGELPLPVQAKLLRVLESGETRRIGGENAIQTDVRLVCATNRDLKKMVADGSFREDLYYRLNVLPIKIPPLRERREDILTLAKAFLDEFNRKNGAEKVFSPQAIYSIQNHRWPGNVRELRNMVERAVITSPTNIITAKLVTPDLETGDVRAEPMPKEAPGAVRAEPMSKEPSGAVQPLKASMRQYERQCLISALNTCGNDIQRAADLLGIHRSGLYRKLHDYQIRCGTEEPSPDSGP